MTDREQRFVFGEIAGEYDDARPSYPPAAFDSVLSFGALQRGDPALEIGAGTGLATRDFLARGLRVRALEPSAGMAEVLRTKAIDVVETTFEDAVLEPGAYRLVFAAQSWHWVTVAGRCEKVAAALAPGGTVALIWNKGQHHPEPFKSKNDAIYRRLWPRDQPHTREWDTHGVVDEFAACGLFEPVAERVITWEWQYTSAEWTRLLGTHSNHRMLDDDLRAQLHTEIGACIDAELGGVLPVVYDTLLFLSRRS